MSKMKKPASITNNLSPSESIFQVEVEFEGKIYEAQCSIVALNAHDKFRCRISYRDVPPVTFGMYSSATQLDIKDDAEREFTALLSGLHKERRIPKCNV